MDFVHPHVHVSPTGTPTKGRVRNSQPGQVGDTQLGASPTCLRRAAAANWAGAPALGAEAVNSDVPIGCE